VKKGGLELSSSPLEQEMGPEVMSLKSQSFSVFHHFCVFCGAYEKEVMTRLEVHFEALCCL
jgi:hypothetical protein